MNFVPVNIFTLISKTIEEESTHHENVISEMRRKHALEVDFCQGVLEKIR